MNVRIDSDEALYLNHHQCPECDDEWISVYDSQCDDQCSLCHTSSSPVASVPVIENGQISDEINGVLEPA